MNSAAIQSSSPQPRKNKPGAGRPSNTPGCSIEEQIGYRLRLFRKHLKMSLVNMAIDMDIPFSTLSKYENGTYAIPLIVPLYLHTKYKMSLDWFFANKGLKTVTAEVKKSAILDIAKITQMQEAQTAKLASLEQMVFNLVADNKKLRLELKELAIKP